MASQEQISASLPDTQNADGVLTQSQPSQGVSSQQPTMIVWGRLCAMRDSVQSLDMINDNVYTVGRSEDCSVNLSLNEVHTKWLSTISKIHFRIYRERIKNTNETVVYLEDTSHNGTYVDRKLVGSGKRVIIGNMSAIALSRTCFQVFVFMAANIDLAYTLPLELKQKYAIGRKLGAGACGEVRLLFTKDGSEMFAIKIIKKNGFFSGSKNILNNPLNIKNEVEILKKLRHPCIIHMKDIHDSIEAMYIVLELMEGGELLDRIRSKGKLSEPCAKLIFYQVVLAVHYLHRQGITHRDLKPENILLKDNSDKPLVKVTDFGMSKLVDAQTMMKTFCGTALYVAPEILMTNGRSFYTSQVDVWSLGVILYICLSGTIPFQNKNATLEYQIINGVYEFRHFRHISNDALKLIKCMLTVNPKERITVTQILLHPWLRDTRMRAEVNELISNNNVEENDENDENIPPSCSNVCHKRQRLF